MRSGQFNLALSLGFLSIVAASAQACNSDEETTTSTGTTSAATTGSSSAGTGSTGAGGGESCGLGTELCGGACTVTAVDPDNCGACGKVCGQGESCDEGACVLECNGGSSKCGVSCVDLQSNPENCGICGKTCVAGQEVCSAGQCASTCGDNLTRCGASCLDTTSDQLNCGACGSPCAGTDKCVASLCVAQTPPKGVYTMSNDPSGNQILAFARAADGTLSPSGTFTATGGKGTGAGLGNQNGLVFDAGRNLFFAVNAGDSSISMLSLQLDGGLKLLTNIDSGGVRPVSITVSGGLVYVLNAGMAGGAAANISGFTLAGGTLTHLAGSTLPLSAPNPNPAQIQFTHDGKALVVTEKGTNTLDTYPIVGDLATGPLTKVSVGQTPFGFDFSANHQLIVSEAFGGQAGMASASSYAVGADGALTTVTGGLATTRTSACWLAVAGDYAYVSNAMSNDITGFKVAADGALTLLNPGGVTGLAGKGPLDDDATDGNDFLYVVNNGDKSFSIFQIGADGSLTKKPDFVGLPSTVSGLVAR